MPGAPGTISLLTIGEAPAAAMAMTYIAMGRTMALAMENAVAAQQRGQVIGETATVQALAMVIAGGAIGMAKG